MAVVTSLNRAHWTSSEQGGEDYEATEQNGVANEQDYASNSLRMRDSCYHRRGWNTDALHYTEVKLWILETAENENSCNESYR
jgi:hypothetical protein